MGFSMLKGRLIRRKRIDRNKEIHHVLESRPKTLPAPGSTLCLPREQGFVANEALLGSIHEILSDFGLRVALVGVSGIGKSSLALEYVHRALEKNSETLGLWIDATNRASASESYRRIANQMSLFESNDSDKNVFQLVHDWLEHTEKPWVLVLDNMKEDILLHHSPQSSQGDAVYGSESSVSGHSFLASIPRGRHLHRKIILTTRNRQTAQRFTPRLGIFNIRPMKAQLALRLLRRKLRFRLEKEVLMQLIARVGGIPLLLSRVAAYMNLMTANETASKQKGDMFGAVSQNGDSDSRLRALLLDIFERTDEAALEIVSFMSFFEPRELNESLTWLLPEAEMMTSEAGRRVFHPEMIGRKYHYHIVDIFGQKRYLSHRLKDIEADLGILLIRRSNWTSIVSNLLNSQLIQTLHREFVAKFELPLELLYPHVLGAALYKPKDSNLSPLWTWEKLLHRGASYAITLPRIANIEETSVISGDMWTDPLHTLDPEIMKSSLLWILGAASKGQWEYMGFLTGETFLFGRHFAREEYALTLSCKDYLTVANYQQSRFKEAGFLLRKSFQMTRSFSGQDYIELLRVISNLVAMYKRQDRWAEVEELNTKVLGLCQRVLGEEHLNTLTSMNNIAEALIYQGKFKRALRLLLRVIKIRKRTLDPNHPHTLVSMNNIAVVYHKQCRLREAEPIYLHLIETYGTMQGSSHHDTIIAMANLAANYRSQGRLKKAEDLQSQVLAAREKVLGTDHPDTLRAIVDLTDLKSQRPFDMTEGGLEGFRPRKRVISREVDRPRIMKRVISDIKHGKINKVGDRQHREQYLPRRNSSRQLEEEIDDYAVPSLRAIMMKWIVEKHRAGNISNRKRRDLEVIVSELQRIPAEDVSITFDDDNSIINKLKGKWETFTGETWDWRPLNPYMRPLKGGEARLQWICACGQDRWAEVPLAFASTVATAPSSIVQPIPRNDDTHRGVSRHQNSNTSSQNSSSQIGSQNQAETPGPHHSLSVPPPQPGTRPISDLHVFLILRHSSLLRSSRRLAQTSVNFSSDDDFFSWIRSMYYTHRGFFPVWFGIHRYSHCEFFKFQRFRPSGFAPLCPEYPSDQEKSYHFSPRPISPDPPISPHEFSDRFADQVWHHAFMQRAYDVWSQNSSNNSSTSYNVIQEKLPKRDTVLEEKDSSHEIFWGLYVVEKRAVGILALYSLAFLSPTFYFFFAWMFQWEHYGDLQNAAVPLTLSIGLIGTLFGIVSLNSPRFEGHAVIY